MRVPHPCVLCKGGNHGPLQLSLESLQLNLEFCNQSWSVRPTLSQKTRKDGAPTARITSAKLLRRRMYAPDYFKPCPITFLTPTAESAASTGVITLRHQKILRSLGRIRSNAKKTNGSAGITKRMKLPRAQIR